MRWNSKLAAALAIVLCTSAAQAQVEPWRTEGLFASAQIVGFTQPENGTAFGIELGFGGTRHFSVLLGLDLGGAAVRDTMRMVGHADLALRAYPLAARRIAPFAEVAFSSEGAETSVDDMEVNTGFTWGVGAEWFYKPSRSVVAHIKRTEIGDDPSYRFAFGAMLRPPRLQR
jgi:hypothetical protein